jgi:hypothetical protein
MLQMRMTRYGRYCPMWLAIAGCFWITRGMLSQDSPQRVSKAYVVDSSPKLEALKMADFLLALQTANGAIVDEAGGKRVNEDSNMEYALIGLGAAYSATKNPKYLEGLENGIKWLAAREEMNDPRWRGSWYLAYSSKSDEHLPTAAGPGVSDARGVDATSALFVYLLYLDQRLSGNRILADTYAENGRAALEFIIKYNLDKDGFSQSSWLYTDNDSKWVLFKEKYSADQGDVYLGMHAGELLYEDPRFRQIAASLRKATPSKMFSPEAERYGLGVDEHGQLDTSDDGNSAAFSQGYLTWMWGNTRENRAATEWLRAKVGQDGSIVTVPGKPAFSLSIAMLGLADAALSNAPPVPSLHWLIETTYDPKTGGVRHSSELSDKSESNNETAFCVIAFLRFLPFA